MGYVCRFKASQIDNTLILSVRYMYMSIDVYRLSQIKCIQSHKGTHIIHEKKKTQFKLLVRRGRVEQNTRVNMCCGTIGQ